MWCRIGLLLSLSPAVAAAESVVAVRTLPAGSFGCIRACVIVAFILVIILVALACAAAWFLTDYASQASAGGNLVSTLTFFFINDIPSQLASVPTALT